jgi:hypothetical protein
MPVAACSEYEPLSSVGIPQTYSITSSPRCTSPCASDRTLPCSAVSRRARSSRCWSNRSWIRKKRSARFDSETVRQLANASCAVATARSISSIDANATSPDCSPVAGL